MITYRDADAKSIMMFVIVIDTLNALQVSMVQMDLVATTYQKHQLFTMRIEIILHSGHDKLADNIGNVSMCIYLTNLASYYMIDKHISSRYRLYSSLVSVRILTIVVNYDERSCSCLSHIYCLLTSRFKFGLRWHMMPIGDTRIAQHCTNNWRKHIR